MCDIYRRLNHYDKQYCMTSIDVSTTWLVNGWDAVFHIPKISYLEEVKVSVYKQENPYTNLPMDDKWVPYSKTARSLYATSYSIKHFHLATSMNFLVTKPAIHITLKTVHNVHLHIS
jgi:hypothetical protein